MSSNSRLQLAPDEHFGRKLGKYEILCRLSTGGMSEIFLAFQRGVAGFTKFVVLKQILPDIRDDDAFVQMFLREAKISAALAHPNIAQVFDLGTEGDELFLAMEFVQGATLVDVARACRAAGEAIPIGFTLAAVRDTARALHYAHTFTDPIGRIEQVIHRDVAEKNVMMTFEGVTKLLDFGIAKNLASDHRTRRGILKGTVGYIAPEQISGQKLDGRSDVFSLGVVLYQCLTEVMLFHGQTPEQQLEATMKGPVPPPSRRNKRVTPEVDGIVFRALERDRERRFPTALDMAKEIERVGGDLIWRPDQRAAFVKRLFADRLDSIHQLLGAVQTGQTGETSQFLLEQLNPPKPSQAQTTPPRRMTKDIPAQAQTTPPRRMTKDIPAPAASTNPDGLAHRTAAEEEEEEWTEASPAEDPAGITRIDKHPPSRAERARSETTSPPRRVDLAEQTLAEDLSGATFPPSGDDSRDDDSRSRSWEDDSRSERLSVRASPSLTHPGSHRVQWTVAAAAAFVFVAIVALWVTKDEKPAAVPLERIPSASVKLPARNGPPTQAAPVPSVDDAPTPTEPSNTVSTPPNAQPAPTSNDEQDEVTHEPIDEKVAASEPAEPDSSEKPSNPTATNVTPPKRPAPKPTPPPRRIASRPVVPKRNDPPPSARATAEPEAPVRAGPGFLSLATEPRATVLFKAQSLGMTPLTKVSLPPGSHQLRLRGPDEEIRTIQVKVEAGETTQMRVKLDALALE